MKQQRGGIFKQISEPKEWFKNGGGGGNFEINWSQKPQPTALNTKVAVKGGPFYNPESTQLEENPALTERPQAARKLAPKKWWKGCCTNPKAQVGPGNHTPT